MGIVTKLDGLNFALAGAREGFGPFLGVYMQAKGFDPASTGLAMSLAGLSGLVATAPIGVLIDRVHAKRLLMVVAVAAIAIGAVLIVATRSIWVVGAAQLLIGVGDTTIAPLLAAITLGIVGPKVFAATLSRNEAYNHAGNAVNAALSACLGYALGLGYVAIAIVVMAAASAAALTRIDPRSIDHARASGGEADGRGTLQVLTQTPGLLLLAATVMLFQTSSGALLPFLAQARTAAGSDPSITTGVMTVVAQVSMVVAALVAGRVGARFGQARVMTIGLGIAVVRGLVASRAGSWAPVIFVEVLEGAAMGLIGVAIPALAATVMHGSGRSSAGLGAVLTAFGAGATLSPLIAGYMAQWFGYATSFVVLAALAAVGLVIWTMGRAWLGIGDGVREARITPVSRVKHSSAGTRVGAVVSSSFPAFALLYAALYGAYGTESPFFPAFLAARNLSAREIGIVLSIGTGVRLCSGTLLGMIADRFGTRRVLAIAAASASVIALLYLPSSGFVSLLAVSMFHSLAIAPLSSLADALALTASENEAVYPYGWVRGVGSASFLIGTLLSGLLVARFGLGAIIVASSAGFVMMVVPIPRLPSTSRSTERLSGGASTLMLSPPFRLTLIVAALVIGSHAMSDAFAVIHWRTVGIAAVTISGLLAEAIGSEILVFFLVGPALLRRFGPARCVIIAAVAGAIRWAVFAQTTDVSFLAATELLHGLTFSLVHLACMETIAANVPEALSATAQTIYGTVCLGVVSAAITLLSGILYGSLGAQAFWLMTALCIAAIPIAVRLNYRLGTGGAMAGS